MRLFKKGQTIEVGIGEDIHDENGHSIYIFIDIEAITENEVENRFPTENILYVNAVTDNQSIDWGKDNPISKYFVKHNDARTLRFVDASKDTREYPQ